LGSWSLHNRDSSLSVRTVACMHDVERSGEYPEGAGAAGADLAMVAWDNAQRLFRTPIGEADVAAVEAAGGLLLALPNEDGLDVEKANAAVRAAIEADLDFRLAPRLRLGV
jgi:hypothetical protein